ncbi:hypothetical protein [Kozakia baliensis]|nr:hypothetical protein [Kozakia baliensis]
MARPRSGFTIAAAGRLWRVLYSDPFLLFVLPSTDERDIGGR